MSITIFLDVLETSLIEQVCQPTFFVCTSFQTLTTGNKVPLSKFQLKTKYFTFAKRSTWHHLNGYTSLMLSPICPLGVTFEDFLILPSNCLSSFKINTYNSFVALFWLKNRSWDRGHNFSYKMYLEKLKEVSVKKSMLNKNLFWFFETLLQLPKISL